MKTDNEKDITLDDLCKTLETLGAFERTLQEAKSNWEFMTVAEKMKFIAAFEKLTTAAEAF